jgi:hypothetical protein
MSFISGSFTRKKEKILNIQNPIYHKKIITNLTYLNHNKNIHHYFKYKFYTPLSILDKL